MGFSFKDFLKEGGELALALTGFLFGPIAGIIGLGGYGVSKLIKGLFGKDEAKDKAKNGAKQEIDKARGKAKIQLNKTLQVINSQLDNLKVSIVEKISNDIANSKAMQDLLEGVQQTLKNKK